MVRAAQAVCSDAIPMVLHREGEPLNTFDVERGADAVQQAGTAEQPAKAEVCGPNAIEQGDKDKLAHFSASGPHVASGAVGPGA